MNFGDYANNQVAGPMGKKKKKTVVKKKKKKKQRE